MLDIRKISDDADAIAQRLARRGGGIDLAPLVALDGRRRALIQQGDALKHSRSQAQAEMKTADKKSPAFAELRDRMRAVSQEIKQLDESLKAVEAEIRETLLTIPNVPDDAVPDGKTDADNQLLRTWGEPTGFDFEPREHVAIGEGLGILDFEAGAKISGARFAVYRGAGARLERALMNFFLDVATGEHGYTEMLTPCLVNEESMTGTGQFPKFRDDAFTATDGLVLLPTAEVSLVNMHRDEVIDYDRLPIRYCGFTPCFRREAGSYGKDTRGLIRLHQFQKVELVQFTSAEDSDAALEALVGHAETLLKRLELPHRVSMLCAGDLGFSMARTYDIEVWLPGQNAYREISSCSNARDYQARRAAIRHRPAEGGKPQLVHTLNGSGLAIGRTVVAILENYQQADGTVRIPDALVPYMGGLEVIAPAG